MWTTKRIRITDLFCSNVISLEIFSSYLIADSWVKCSGKTLVLYGFYRAASFPGRLERVDKESAKVKIFGNGSSSTVAKTHGFWRVVEEATYPGISDKFGFKKTSPGPLGGGGSAGARRRVATLISKKSKTLGERSDSHETALGERCCGPV